MSQPDPTPRRGRSVGRKLPPLRSPKREQTPEWTRFKDLTRKLVNVSKQDVDEKRKEK